MSTINLIKCGCCGDDVEEEKTFMDPDLEKPVCVVFCKEALRWAHAQLRRRTPNGVSITGIHGRREAPILWNPKLAEDEYKKWLDSQK